MISIYNKGISLIEILIIICIFSIICAIIIPNFSGFQKQQALKNTSEDIVSMLNEARNDTISSKNSNNYGIHFQNDRAILFSGLSFNQSSIIKQINFESPVEIPINNGVNIGGGNDVIFNKITGETAQSGNIIIQLINDSTRQKIITINSAGIIDVN